MSFAFNNREVKICFGVAMIEKRDILEWEDKWKEVTEIVSRDKLSKLSDSTKEEKMFCLFCRPFSFKKIDYLWSWQKESAGKKKHN